MAGPLDSAHAVTKLPAQDLDRARRSTVTASDSRPPKNARRTALRVRDDGVPSVPLLRNRLGHSTQIGFEVDDLDRVVASYARGLRFETVDVPHFTADGDIVTVPGNYPSKGNGERGAFFRDSEGNLLSLGQATR